MRISSYYHTPLSPSQKRTPNPNQNLTNNLISLMLAQAIAIACMHSDSVIPFACLCLNGMSGRRSGLWPLSVLCTLSIALGIAFRKSKLTLHHLLPLRLQHSIRDSGWGRAIADTAVILSVPALLLIQPGVLLQYLRARSHLHVHNYGNGTKERLEVFANLEHAPRNRKVGEGHGVDIETQMNDYYSDSNTEKKGEQLVLVFVHGGAWGSGSPWMYTLVALGVSKCLNASTAVIVEYPVYPDSYVPDQADW